MTEPDRGSGKKNIQNNVAREVHVNENRLVEHSQAVCTVIKTVDLKSERALDEITLPGMKRGDPATLR
jgi:hypothetical protein